MNKKLVSALGIIALLLWIALFSTGLLVSSESYRKELMEGNVSLFNLTLAALLYTPTNVVLLSVLAGLIGGCASLLYDQDGLEERIGKALASGQQAVALRLERRSRYLKESPLLSMLRGFLVYLGVVSGVLVVISNPFANPTPEQFIRLAGLISAVAFAMGYDPTRFEDLIEKLSSLGQKPPSGS